MESFRCIRLSILAEAKNHIQLPAYQGGALRGAFGYALKRAVCTMKDQNECLACMLKDHCVYSYVFETPPPADAEVLRLYPYAPHPFIINPMTNGEGRHEPGNELKFGMTLVGRAIEFLPYFIYGFTRMGQIGLGKGRGMFNVKKVELLDSTGNQAETVYQNETLKSAETVLKYKDALELSENHKSDEISIMFKTPLRVKFRGHFHDIPDFHILIRNLIRRLSNLLYFHCNHQVDLPFKEIINKAQQIEMTENNTRWFDWKRYSGRQNRKMKMGGIVGSATYSGNLKEFLPLLFLGSWVNAGKGTSFGLGSYRIKL